jgi:hypothetical protein
VDARADLLGGVARRRRQTDAREDRQIQDVVAHVGDLLVVEREAGDDLVVRLELARDALVHERDAELRRPLRGRRRRARRQKTDRESRALRPHDGRAVLDVEDLALAAVGVHHDLPVGQHAVDVEQDQANLRRA